jgi:hypothetical protein
MSIGMVILWKQKVGKVILCCPTYNGLFSCLREEHFMWIIMFPYSMSAKNIVHQKSVIVKVRKPYLNGTITIQCKQGRIYTIFSEKYNSKHVRNNTTKMLLKCIKFQGRQYCSS